MLTVREYTEHDIPEMISVWNEVVDEGNAFPQEERLDERSGAEFFASQSRCGVAVEDGAVIGMYILHPNNVGRCGHICNASYAVSAEHRGRHIGEALVRDCMAAAGELGFGILQFNAVVADNIAARRLYERLGFTQLGTIPGGFRLNSGEYVDICPYYIVVRN